MPDALERLQHAQRSSKGLVPFVGSGLSVAATHNAKHASWSGLILDGIDLCQRSLPDLRSGWADGLREHLRQGDVTSYLTVGQEVSWRLQRWADGRLFTNWIRDGVGALEVADPALPNAVGQLGHRILTTNYDTILEQVCGYKTVSWTDRDAVADLRSDQRIVFHLHGAATDPLSVILGWTDYQHLADSKLQTFIKQALGLTETFIFIGCGSGLEDPSVGPALQLVDDLLPEENVEHFLLVIGRELRTALKNQRPRMIQPIAYGAEHVELPRFLANLAAGRVPSVTQDPAAYEHKPATRPLVALLDLAGPADERLGDALEATRRALRALGQLERRTARPSGLPTWDLADQQAVLEQLAAAGAVSSAWLATAAAQLALAVRDAADLASQLLARRFMERRERLQPLVRNLEELDTLLSDLEYRIRDLLADFTERGRDVDTYKECISALAESNTHVEESRQSTTSLLNGFKHRI